VTITLHDERLSSHVAESRLGPMKRGRSGGPPSRQQRNEYRARVDREAAAVILQDALDTRQTATDPQRRPSTAEIPS
jgi:RNase H-fold protein (predicted Holliday junction resolvase)